MTRLTPSEVVVRELQTTDVSGYKTKESPIVLAKTAKTALSPSGQKEVAEEVFRRSQRMRETAEKRHLDGDDPVTSQIRGAMGECTVEKILTPFGTLERLPVDQSEGAHTADYLLTVTKEFAFSRTKIMRIGEKYIVEVKKGSPRYVANELRNPDSHARLQMKESIRKHGADGAICMVPMDTQKREFHNAMMSAQKSIRENGEPVYIWKILPTEGATREGVKLALAS